MISLLKLILSNYKNQEKNLINLKQEKDQISKDLDQEKLLKKVIEDSLSKNENLLNQKNNHAKSSIETIINSVNQNFNSLESEVTERTEDFYVRIEEAINALDDMIKNFEDNAKSNETTLRAQYDEAINTNNYMGAGQLNALAVGYADAASKFSYIRNELIKNFLKIQISSTKQSFKSTTGNLFLNSKQQILSKTESEKNNFIDNSSQNSSQENNSNNSNFYDSDMYREVDYILSYPWRFINIKINQNNNWFSEEKFDGLPIFREEFINSGNCITVTYDKIRKTEKGENLSVTHISKMLSQGNRYAVIRTVKNAGMLVDPIGPNNTVISFYKREGLNNDNGQEYLTYWDRIFLDTNGANQIYSIISELQVGESLPYGYRQMPSQWDKFISNNAGNVKINIKREAENQFHIYYCEDDNLDINLGTLYKFSLDRENKEIVNCVDCLITVEGNNGPATEIPNKLDPNT